MTFRIIFIDSNIVEYQSLIPQLPKNSSAVILNANEDGILQIVAALQDKTELAAIYIISHGSPGTLLLGSIELNNSSLAKYHDQLREIGQHLAADADILLYGCKVAQGKIGQNFIENLSQLIGVNVAASTTVTGATKLGGDWMLAARTGAIQTPVMQLAYDGTLGTFIGTNGNDVLSGSIANDSFTGGLGNDTLNGSSGRDIAIYSGNVTDYEFSLNGAGLITIRDINLVNGNEGIDTLSSIEFARFAGNKEIEIKPATEEFHVNTFTPNPQTYSTITALVNGGFVVSWQSLSQDSSNYGTYAQRYDASGTPQGNEFKVNTYTLDHQENPTITALTNGGFVISWESRLQDGSNYGIYAQRYDSNGAPQGSEFKVNTFTTNHQMNPSITALTNGGFVVSWQSLSQDGSNYGIYAQRYNANGVAQGSEFRVNTTTQTEQSNPSITKLNDGGFVVSWQSANQDSHGYGIFAQRFNVNGVKLGGEFQVNTHTADAQWQPSITTLANGGFVVSWQSNSQDGSVSGIYAQRFNANGVAQGSEFRVNTYTLNHQSEPSITALTNGGFVVSWQSQNQEGNQKINIYAQRYDANGVAQGGEFLVNTYIQYGGLNPSIAALSDGGFVVSWHSYNDRNELGFGIHAQRYDANGNKIGKLELKGSINADQLKVAATLTSPVFMLGMDGDDTLQGGGANDIVDGGTGDDSLNGGLGTDILRGGLGNDNYVVENAGDVISESLDAGTDKVSSNVTYTLSANVENLTLTGTAAINGTGNTQANNITGNAANNQLIGGSGNDILNGGTGVNVLTGGTGSDIFRFTTSDHSDKITDFNAANDTIQLENAVFSSLTVTGTLAASHFRIGAQAMDANDFIIYNNTTGALLYDANGSGTGAAVQIASLSAGLAITNADIVVI